MLVDLATLALIAAPVLLVTVLGAKMQGRRELYRWPAIWALVVGVGAFLTGVRRPGYTADAALVLGLWQGALTYALGVVIVLVVRRMRRTK